MNKVKINITIDEELYEWLNEKRDMLRERKEAEELIQNYSKDSGTWKEYVKKTLAKIKGGDRFLEILSREYLEEF